VGGYVWNQLERYPRTDDAVARANVIGVTARVSGQIAHIYVMDNQAVKKGDLLFELDPEDYQLDLDRAKAALAALDQQIDAARGQDAQLKFQVKAAEFNLQNAQLQVKQSTDSLNRIQPLLSKGFTTAESVEEAETKRDSAEKLAQTALENLNQANAAVGELGTLLAQRAGVVAAMRTAEVELSYCKVTAPFDGRVISLNISEGAHVTMGVPVFSLLDTRKWYVMANFRETELKHIATGSPVDLYLMAYPEKHFHGVVEGIGWAVTPEDGLVLNGIPYIKRELDWVHIAQRFPVRVRVTDPDENMFRMGASAVAIVK
jgi:multidrug efflux system membrane fusion protein